MSISVEGEDIEGQLAPWTGPSPQDVKRTRDQQEAALKENLIGVALSGGGIRSATFALGLLQGLARHNLLRCVDYLSTVSGGGYIGGWLTAWIRREGEMPMVEGSPLTSADAMLTVEGQMKPDRVSQARGRQQNPNIVFDKDPEPIRHLRAYSNYLTPQVGLLSADSWVILTIYLRNLLLNLLVLVPVVAGAILCMRAVVVFYLWKPNVAWHQGLAVAGALAFLVAFLWVGWELWCLGATRRGTRKTINVARELEGLRWLALVPLMFFGLVLSWLFNSGDQYNPLDLEWIPSLWGLKEWLQDLVPPDPEHLPDAKTRAIYGLITGIPVALLNSAKYLITLLWLLGTFICERKFDGKALGCALWSFVCGAIAGLVYGVLVYFTLGYALKELEETALHFESVFAAIGPPIAVSLIAVAGFIEVGLHGRCLQEDAREWWASLYGWIGIYCAIWTAAFGLALLGPDALSWLGQWSQTAQATAVVGWLATTLFGVLAGKAGYTGKGGRNPLELVAIVGPPVFLAGAIIAVSYGIQQLFGPLPVSKSGTGECATDKAEFAAFLCGVFWGHAIGFFVFAAVALVFAATVGVNTFSLQSMYANRLMRCYLGASRPKDPAQLDRATGPPGNSPTPLRRPDAITGFDPKDDMKLDSLLPGNKYRGPYLIINTALNLVHGDELAWQERKAESFVLTPRYCGSESTGYRPLPGFANHISLGTAVAISGAAASPNMGYHSSPGVTALLTVFNVRLGAWLGNPHGTKWKSAEPHIGMLHLLSELFGRTNARSSYVYLSDGGHFDNTGVYELIRRRCRYILVSDAGADGKYAFADLSALLRKCRSDFGIRIDLGVTRIKRLKRKDGAVMNWALGRIHYEDVHPGAAPGILIYIKPCLTGEDTTDVRGYATANPDFPHQTTLDQFFNESQFESYRMLGQDTAETVVGDVAKTFAEKKVPCDGSVLEKLFQALDDHWHVLAKDDKLSKENS